MCAGTRVTAAAGSADSSQGFNVVITGSTKGVGRAMAEEFLKAGDSVIISSRSGQPQSRCLHNLLQSAWL